MEIETKKAEQERHKELISKKPLQQAAIVGITMALGVFIFYLSSHPVTETKATIAVAPQSSIAVPANLDFEMPPLPQNKTQPVNHQDAEMPAPNTQGAEWEQQLTLAKEGLLQQRRTAPGLLSTAAKAKEDQVTLEVKKAIATPIKNLESLILQGKVVHAVLETAIDSELPGMVRAVVTEDIFAEKGDKVLIPKGTRAIAPYSSASSLGQSRVFLEWKRLILPNGINIPLSSPGVDSLGKAGASGDVDTHFWKRFGEATLMSLISAGAANVDVNGSDEANSAAAYRSAMSQSFANSATASIESKSNLMPTIRINQGSPITIFVAQDIDFSAVMEGA